MYFSPFEVLNRYSGIKLMFNLARQNLIFLIKNIKILETTFNNKTNMQPS